MGYDAGRCRNCGITNTRMTRSAKIPLMTEEHDEPLPDSYYPVKKPERRFETPTDEVLYLLRSMRSMLIFFTVLTILGIIGGVVGVVDLIHAANNSSGF